MKALVWVWLLLKPLCDYTEGDFIFLLQKLHSFVELKVECNAKDEVNCMMMTVNLCHAVGLKPGQSSGSTGPCFVQVNWV